MCSAGDIVMYLLGPYKNISPEAKYYLVTDANAGFSSIVLCR